MKYMLDTNICIYIIKEKPLSVIKRLKEVGLSQVRISSITMSELEYGACKSQHFERNKLALLKFASVIEIIKYDENAAAEYGKIRAELERAGNIIGGLDMLIAAHALSERLTLVTNNEKEFKRVGSLKFENWV